LVQGQISVLLKYKRKASGGAQNAHTDAQEGSVGA